MDDLKSRTPGSRHTLMRVRERLVKDTFDNWIHDIDDCLPSNLQAPLIWRVDSAEECEGGFHKTGISLSECEIWEPSLGWLPFDHAPGLAAEDVRMARWAYQPFLYLHEERGPQRAYFRFVDVQTKGRRLELWGVIVPSHDPLITSLIFNERAAGAAIRQLAHMHGPSLIEALSGLAVFELHDRCARARAYEVRYEPEVVERPAKFRWLPWGGKRIEDSLPPKLRVYMDRLAEDQIYPTADAANLEQVFGIAHLLIESP